MKHLILLTGLAGGMFAATAAFASGIPANTNEPQPTADATVPGSPYKVYKTETAPVPASTSAPAATPSSPTVAAPEAAPATPPPPTTPGEAVPQPAAASDTAPATNAPAVAVVPATLVLVPTNSPAATIVAQGSNTVVLLANGEKGLKMNFRGVPLEAVLNYMSDAAGFIIHPKVDVRGKVDVWSNQPLTSDESVKLLKQILNENGYTAIQDGRTLTIIKSDDAKKSDIPVMSGNNPDLIPKNADIVTQIIPVRTLNVVQLLKDLQPLLPSDATLTADESASSLVMTDTQMNIRRITEIVKALDSVTSSSATIRVFPLVYADAKSLASLIKDLFPSADASKNGGSGGFSFGRFRGGGGGFPGLPGFGGGGESSSDSNGHTPTAKVSAVADDHSNSLIVSAPDGMMDTIAELVHKVDTSVADTTEVHLFHLKNADPVEMADLLSSLFPEDTSSTDATRAQPRFGFGFGGFGGAQTASSSSAESARMKKMSTVVAVADRRTASLVVTAGKDLMPAITNLVQELDKRTDHKQSAHIIPLANADPVDVQQILQEMFQSGSSSSSRTGSSSASSATGNPLLNRQTTLLQQQNSSSSSSFGSGSSSGSRIGN